MQGGPVVIPGLCLPKALQPLLPIFLQVFLLITVDSCILYLKMLLDNFKFPIVISCLFHLLSLNVEAMFHAFMNILVVYGLS